jgi:hypothetical protein
MNFEVAGLVRWPQIAMWLGHARKLSDSLSSFGISTTSSPPTTSQAAENAERTHIL